MLGENEPKSLQLFVINHMVTHSTVWLVMGLDVGEELNKRSVERGTAFQSPDNGPYWQISCNYFNTPAHAERFVKSHTDDEYSARWFDTEIIR